jgi:hypothetical protein
MYVYVDIRKLLELSGLCTWTFSAYCETNPRSCMHKRLSRFKFIKISSFCISQRNAVFFLLPLFLSPSIYVGILLFFRSPWLAQHSIPPPPHAHSRSLTHSLSLHLERKFFPSRISHRLPLFFSLSIAMTRSFSSSARSAVYFFPLPTKG